MKKKLLLLLILITLVIVAVVFYNQFLRQQDVPAGLTKVEDYNYIEEGAGRCMAISPGCGVCYGKVINKECYVDKSKLTKFELEAMGF